MQIDDSVVADMFEKKLLDKGFDYAKMSDSKFVVRSTDLEALNSLVQDVAQEMVDKKNVPMEDLKKEVKAQLKDSKKLVHGNVASKNKVKVKDAVKQFKVKADKKNHNRERQKQKTKNREADRG